MALRIYNTLTRQKEIFETVQPGKVTMYVCGPTVYDKAHVGHAMSSLVFDILRRYLEYSGYQVRHVMNYTDVDDKIINRANQLGMEPVKLAEIYIDEYMKHLADLNVLPATVFPRATQEIPYIIQMINHLGENDYAYEVNGDVYFRVKQDDDYGKLSGRRLEDMQAGSRISVDERKESPMDFALWKSSKPGEPAWESPWGPGRPGWHIECSAMSMHHLGEQIDIHGGGNDLVFPHHENEIAQTESVTGKPFARYWVHNGMMQLAGEKMSKSLGNLVTIEDFLAKHEGDVLRMMVLNSSYRNPLTFGEDVIAQAEKGLERFRLALRPASGGQLTEGAAVDSLRQQIAVSRQGFIDSMDDDIN
ncbi:MAG: cysteine--tRNA ligase, partial [Anaerolineales bacterium]|nr:cysteine--tRNA ligase [Anaerolineales bacterium]